MWVVKVHSGILCKVHLRYMNPLLSCQHVGWLKYLFCYDFRDLISSFELTCRVQRWNIVPIIHGHCCSIIYMSQQQLNVESNFNGFAPHCKAKLIGYDNVSMSFQNKDIPFPSWWYSCVHTALPTTIYNKRAVLALTLSCFVLTLCYKTSRPTVWSMSTYVFFLCSSMI